VSAPSQSALQAETEARLQFEMLLADVCAEFVNVAPSDVDSKIENAQRVICESLSVDHSSVWQVSAENPDLLVLTHVYRDPNLKPLPLRPSAKEYFPWGYNKILNKKIVCVSNTAALPPAAAKDKESWEQYGIHASLAFPLSIGGSVIGVLAFDNMEVHDWPEPLQRRLQILAHVFAQALERKHVEQKVRESENRFRLVADTAPVLIWMSGTDKLCTYLNKPWLDFTGRSLEQELGNGWAEGVHPEDFRRCVDTYTQSFDRRVKFRMEYRIRHHDGEYRWILDIGVPRFDQDGSFVGYIGTAVDVTERKRSEERLREYEKAVEGAEEMIAVVDREYRYLIANRRFLNLRNMKKEQVVDRLVPEVLNEGAFEGVVKEKLDECFTGKVVKYEMKYTYPELGERDLFISYFPIEGASGVDRVACILQDITERKRAEEALQKSEEKFSKAFRESPMALTIIATLMSTRLLRE
jgi:PAS domain S-box-containing protein